LAMRRQSLGSVYVQCAWLALKNKMYVRAMMFLSRAVASDPWFPFRRSLRLMIGRLLSRVFRYGEFAPSER
jgi:hypothetical protein